jgi:hypothetical protein
MKHLQGGLRFHEQGSDRPPEEDWATPMEEQVSYTWIMELSSVITTNYLCDYGSLKADARPQEHHQP